MKRIGRHAVALLAAAVATGLLASLVQTQVNLAELTALGAAIPLPLRAWTTLQDLAGFGPVMIGIAFAALLPALLAAQATGRAAGLARRAPLFAVAAVAGLWAAFWLMLNVIPMPAIAATRGGFEHALMALSGIAGGLVYARMASPARQAAQPRRQVLAVALMALVPAALFLVTAPGAADKLEAVDPASYGVASVATGLDRPWSLAFLPDGRLLVTEMGGRLLVIGADGAKTPIATSALPPIFQRGGTIGLMDVALDPDFERNRLLYLTLGHGEERNSSHAFGV